MTRTIATALLLTLLATAAHAAPPLDAVLPDASALETYRAVTISPDGKSVAWVESIAGADGLPSERSTLEVAALTANGAGAPRQVSAITGLHSSGRHAAASAGAVERDPAWSPDGRRLAFLSDAAHAGQVDLYVAEIGAAGAGGAAGATGAGTAPHRLTRLAGQAAEPRWSPDGRAIALLLIEGRGETAGPLAAVPRDAGVVGETPQEQRLAVVDAAPSSAAAPSNPAVRLVSPADLYVYEYDWAPDGRSFAATAAHGSGDDNWFVAELYSIAADGSSARSLWKPAVQIAAPKVSPDGRSIAVLGGLMSDFGLNGGDVWIVPTAPALEPAAGEPRNVTPGLAASPAWLAWTAPDRLLLVETVEGETAVASLELPAAGAPRVATLWRGAETIAAGGAAPGLALAADGTTSAVLRHSFGRPPEV